MEVIELRPRGISRVVRVGRDDAQIPYRCVEGWRHAGIDRVLDECAMLEGSGLWWVDLSEVTAGDAGYWRGRDQRLSATAKQAKRENNRAQAAKWRERARGEWQQYCAAYNERHGGLTRPIGFDRWSRLYRELWLRDPQAAVAHVNVAGPQFNPSLHHQGTGAPGWMLRVA